MTLYNWLFGGEFVLLTLNADFWMRIKIFDSWHFVKNEGSVSFLLQPTVQLKNAVHKKDTLL